MGQEQLGGSMRYLRTNGSSPLSSLRAISTPLDACWWYLGGNGFSITKEFAARLRPRGWSDTRVDDYWRRCVAEYVVHDTPIGRIGRPGFFRRLGDSVDFSWTCLFAVEAADEASPSLAKAAGSERVLFGPFADLPADVIVAARDVDSAYQEYGFRDEWMFKAVLGELRGRGLPADEATTWPSPGNRRSAAARPAP
jgi:hypothetical protein